MLPPVFADKIEQQKVASKPFVLPPCEDEEDESCLSNKFRASVDEYMDKILLGLFALTDEEIAERRAEFEARFKPQEPYCDTEMAAFAEAYRDFTRMLYTLQAEQRPESLITSSAENDDDCEDEYARSLLPSNPLLQAALHPSGNLWKG